MILRPAALADLPAVQALLAETWLATYAVWLGAEKVAEITARWHSIAALAEQVDAPGAAFLIAEVDGVLAGTAFAHATDDGGVEIGRLYVHPARQGRGIGAALLAAVTARFPGAERFVLDVDPRNEAAIRFYRRHGFAVAGHGTDCGGAGSGLAHVRLQRAVAQISTTSITPGTVIS